MENIERDDLYKYCMNTCDKECIGCSSRWYTTLVDLIVRLDKAHVNKDYKELNDVSQELIYIHPTYGLELCQWFLQDNKGSFNTIEDLAFNFMNRLNEKDRDDREQLDELDRIYFHMTINEDECEWMDMSEQIRKDENDEF